METYKLQTHARNVDCDVVVVVAIRPSPDPDWEAFVNRTYGALADDPIERPEPLPLEERDTIE